MGYCIQKLSYNERCNTFSLFLADRSKTIQRWWTYKASEAFIYHSKEACEKKAKSLKFDSHRYNVITEEEMRRLSDINALTKPYRQEFYGEHPFSSDALGQY